MKSNYNFLLNKCVNHVYFLSPQCYFSFFKIRKL